MTTPLDAKENYQSSAQYKKRKNFNQTIGEPHFSLAEELLKQLDLTGNEKILDVGCGFGDVLLLIEKQGHQGKLVGIDQSDGMITEAKKTSQTNIEFQVAKAEKLPFGDASFDLIICKHALYHFSVQVALAEMRRVLKSHGRLILTLNSLTRESRKHVEHYKKFLAEQLHSDYPNTTSNANFENYQNYINGFRILKEVLLCRYAKMTNKESFVEYMSSFHEVFSPTPSEISWAKALTALGAIIDKEITAKGSLEERLFVGISVLEKID